MNTQTLASLFKGSVILPNNPRYDEIRQVFYGGIDKKPAAIIRVADSEDVKKAINLAKEHDRELAIRSGGHSVAGYSSSDGGIVIDLRDMRKLEINPTDKTAWIETGLTAGEVTNELDKYNLALGFGDTGSVGIGGITLGGGVGFLVRKYGLTIDNLLAAEIVLSSGEVVEVNDKNHPDLFWALRGGGGNFGIVTKFKYQLHDLHECYGGMLILPATPEVITEFIHITEAAPHELSIIINIMPTFPMPFISKEHHGKLSLMALMVYAGDPTEGEKVVAPLKALAKPYADLTKPMRYKDIFSPEGESYHPTAVSKNMHLNTFDVETAQSAMNWLEKIEAPVKALQLRVLGGKMAEVPVDATAYAHRKQAIMANIAAFYETEAEKEEKLKWLEEFSQSLYQGDASAYVGFLGATEQDRLLSAYPEPTLKKLKEVKKRYDPDNFFHLNFNIQP